jgi:hypothetical protein
MPKMIKLEPHLESKELEDRYRKARDPVLRSRYQILWLISLGKTTSRVMEATGYAPGAGSNNSLAVTTPLALRRLETVVTETRAPEIGRCSAPSNGRNSERR